MGWKSKSKGWIGRDPPSRRFSNAKRRTGMGVRHVPNEMNYAMDARLIYCLRHGLPLDIDVYDAAEWSCLTELSEISAREGSRPVPVPDFTNGRWDLLHGHRFYTADSAN